MNAKQLWAKVPDFNGRLLVSTRGHLAVINNPNDPPEKRELIDVTSLLLTDRATGKVGWFFLDPKNFNPRFYTRDELMRVFDGSDAAIDIDTSYDEDAKECLVDIILPKAST